MKKLIILCLALPLLVAQVSFLEPQSLSTISSNSSFIIDLDSDSDSDILFGSFSNEALYWLEND
ncbi:MAG: hypothetical protein QF859_05610, partial [Candidatus Marinimicrobia bacterium]|nr:hypothetical protein [Candidatus Neomarinimicrobiota bacterium]